VKHLIGASFKHSNLLRIFENYDRTKFYNVDRRTKIFAKSSGTSPSRFARHFGAYFYGEKKKILNFFLFRIKDLFPIKHFDQSSQQIS
jgi:hypothetical protein